MIRGALTLAIALAALLAEDDRPGGETPRAAAAPPPQPAASLAPAEAHPRARSPEEALLGLLESLDAVRKGPVPVKEIAERLATEIDAARRELRAVRAELESARKESENLRARIEAAEVSEERLIARLDGARVALLLLEKKLPRAEALSLLPVGRVHEASSLDPSMAGRSRALYRERIGPLFSASCRRCHDDKKRRGDLVLLTRESMLAGGAQGPAVIPGKPDKSLLYLLVSRKKEPHMPPGKELPGEDVRAIREWIESGAAWADPEEREF